MGFSINSNPFANIVQTELYLNTPALTQAITRLSTGLRINSAADDPAGLAITNNLQAQVSGLDQNQLNIQDSISLVQTASQSLSGTQTILENMLQLATRAATGTNSSSDVAAMQTEMNQLAQQITGTANSTTFNSQNLLAGALQNFQTQLGPDAGDSSSFSIAPMDAASIGVAGSAANITAAQNTANVNALSEVGTGFLGANQGESYQIAATTITTGGAGGTYNLVGAASANGTAAQNLGKESLGVSGAGAATTLYTVQVTGVTNGAITAIRYATGTGTPTWTNVTATSGNFSLGGTLVGAFTNGAATPQAGDQFTFTTNGGGTAGAVTAGTNADSNSTGVVGGAYTGTTNLQYVVRASGIDGANNVNTVQVSTDGGQTFGSSIAISAGTFALGNGLNFTWNKGTVNPAQAAANGDSFSFNAVAANQSVQLLQLSDNTTVGGVAKFTGSAANIGSGLLLNAGQTSANLGTGAQTITANFGAPGTVGGIQAGATPFTVANPQAAIVSNGTVVENAQAPAGLNIGTTAAASAAIAQIDAAISAVSAQQSSLGAQQIGLQQSLAQATAASMDLSSATSSILDANIAQEMVNLTRARILQQSDIALLAQANQIPELVLKLLGN